MEGNVVAAATIFGSSIVLDALSALPTTLEVDVPTSLRSTSLVLVALIAAPPVEANLLFEQRGLAGVLLVGVSWFGLHRGGINARIADAVYAVFCTWCAVGFFATGHSAHGHDERGRRENAMALAAALLAYSGLRAARAGTVHASEALSFSMFDEDVETRGVALADDVVACAMVFGGLLCVATAVLILSNHDVVYMKGSSTVSSVVGMLSVLVFTSAFVVQVVGSVKTNELAVIFGDGACSGAHCFAANRARRMHVSNHNASALWACAIGLTILAFPRSRRCQTRFEYYNTSLSDKQSAWVSAASTAVVILVLNSFFDESRIAGTEMLLLYLSIPVAWYGEAAVGCALHATGIGIYTTSRLGSTLGYDLTYMTHWFVAATFMLCIFLSLAALASRILYKSCCTDKHYISWLEISIALALVALVSMQLLLSVSTLSLASGYDGSAMHDIDTKFFVEFSSLHFLSFFFSAALVGGRFEPQNPRIDRVWLRSTWFGIPAFLVANWIVAMLRSQSGVPYFSVGSPVVICVASIAALVPWVVVGVVVC